MRVAELTQVVFSSYFVVLSFLRPLALRQRIRVTLLGAVAIGSLFFVLWVSPFLPPLHLSFMRDWLPAALLLTVYWQAGQFFTQPNQNFQGRLRAFDRKLLGALFERWASEKTGSWFFDYLELAYLMCYPLVPFGLGALYAADMHRFADEYWAVVLPSSYLCYAVTPFFQALPPRTLAAGEELGLRPTRIRRWNLWLLRHASIQAITFPSAHVAATMAAALVLLRRVPLAGVVFLWVAISISVGAVVGRYHYLADVLLGAAVALAVFLVGYWFW